MHRPAAPAATLANLALAAAALLAVGCRTSPTATPPISRDVTVQELRRDLYAFAADSFLGRETGTEAADRAARFLAQRLRALGVEPAGDSGYFQRVPLMRGGYGPGTRFEVAGTGGGPPPPPGPRLGPAPVAGPGPPAAAPAGRRRADVPRLRERPEPRRRG